MSILCNSYTMYLINSEINGHISCLIIYLKYRHYRSLIICIIIVLCIRMYEIITIVKIQIKLMT